MEKRVPVLWNHQKDCCGCSACLAVCPTNAIYMEMNERGFQYPKIDQDKCIGCHSCEKVCSYKTDLDSNVQSKAQYEIYGVKAKDRNIIKSSSSGGMFTILSDWILAHGGAIISALYNMEKSIVEYKLYTDVGTRDSARGSKYIQADMDNVFREGYGWLQHNPKENLMFVGTGCQVAGFRAYTEFKKVRDRVILVDLICHGAPSPGLWLKYADGLQKEHGAVPQNVVFKDKRNGWMEPTVYASINGEELCIEGYSGWFYGDYSLRESCYQCPYTQIERNSDITIGDFWGVNNVYPEFYDFMGVSLVIVQSEMGKNIFEMIKDKIDCISLEEKDCLQPRLISPATRPKNADKFWKDIHSKGLEYCEKKYTEYHRNTVFDKVITKLRGIIKTMLR